MFNPHLENIVRFALEETLGHGDLTTRLVMDAKPVLDGPAIGRGEITAGQDLVVSGLEPARLVYYLLNPAVEFEPMVSDGDSARSGQVLVRLSGPLESLLAGEPAALNFLTHLSGVATFTARFVARTAGQKARVIDTRKTSAGLRALEKAAVRHGGGGNHRTGLHDGILIKENHIAAAGSITQAVTLARNGAPHYLKVEVEVENLTQLQEALAAKADIILLDNMSPGEMAEAVAAVQGRALTMASGGVNLDNLAVVAATGVDLVAIGALTHSAPAADLGLVYLDATDNA